MMNGAVVQTLWADLIACTLRDAGVALCVISPGSRSTPLVAALIDAAHGSAASGRARTTDLELVTVIDERAAAFYALGAARATGRPVALLCTSGSAAAHYLPALVEAAHAGVPLIAITANRPPELHDCGASQTIDQRAIYGGFVRGSVELGAPVGEPLALRAVRRKIIQAVTLALGPDPGPVHIDAAFTKPLEPAMASSDDESALADLARRLISQPVVVAPPRLAPDQDAIETVTRAIASEPRGVIVVGALPATFAARDAVFELARRAGYPIIAETGSQLRLGARSEDVVFADHFDLFAMRAPCPALILHLGSEPVAAAWPGFLARASSASRWVLAGPRWLDPDSSADAVVLGDLEIAIAALAMGLGDAETTVDLRASSRRRIERAAASLDWQADWRDCELGAARALTTALTNHPGNEISVVEAALAGVPATATVQIGNSLPIRIVDHIPARSSNLTVITQRGAAGIDGLVASAAGATRAGKPVLLILGDVSFAHDVGGLLAARAAAAPLAILVIDNAGGQIFGGLPIGKAGLGDAFDRHWLTAPQLDIAAVAEAFGLRALTASSPETVGAAITRALGSSGVTIVHAPVTATGARDVRTAAIALAARAPTRESPASPEPTPRTAARDPLAPAARLGGPP